MLDGWKNSSNNTRNVAGVLKFAYGAIVFLGTQDFSLIQETTENLLEKLVDYFVPRAKQLYNCVIDSVVTDNANNMTSFSNSSNLISYTCMAHTGNLLLNELFDHELGNKLRNLMKHFKKSYFEGKLITFGGAKIYLAGDTRWCGKVDEMKCFVKNRAAMKKVIALDDNPYETEPDVMQLLYSDAFYSEVQKHIELLEPIAIFIDFAQSDKTSLADGVGKIFELGIDLMIISARRENQFLSKAAKLSYLLHPRHRGQHLSPNDIAMLRLSLIRPLADVHHANSDTRHLENFLKSKDFFAQPELDLIRDDPEVFWTTVEAICPKLSKIALTYCKLPASTAALERLFSQWSYVHNKTRNRLTQDKSEKLIHCYSSLKMQHPFDEE